MRFALCIIALLSTTSCAIMGRQQRQNPISPENVAKVTKGMTKSQVTALLGAPDEIIFSNKKLDPLREHAYKFEHTLTKYTGITFLVLTFGNVDEKKDVVFVFFDENGLVESIGNSLHAADSSYGFPFGS